MCAAPAFPPDLAFQPGPAFQPVTRDNLTARVYHQLRTALMEGRFWPGQRLKIRDLATTLQVSETPIREAIMQLVRERGLEMQANRAITVASLTLAQYREQRRIRLELEGLAAAEAAARIEPQEIAELERHHTTLLSATQAQNWPTAVRANWQFHHTVYRNAGMPELLNIIETLWLRTGPLLNYQYPHAVPTYPGRHRHHDVLDAMRAQDPVAARAAIYNDTVEGGATLLNLLIEIDAGRLILAQPHLAETRPPAP